MSQVGGNFTETDPNSLPLAGGTMTGAITLANIAGAVTTGGTTTTFQSGSASGANAFVFRATSTYTGAGLFRIQDGSGPGTSGDRVHISSDVSNVTVVNIISGNSGNGLQIRSGNSPIR